MIEQTSLRKNLFAMSIIALINCFFMFLEKDFLSFTSFFYLIFHVLNLFFVFVLVLDYFRYKQIYSIYFSNGEILRKFLNINLIFYVCSFINIILKFIIFKYHSVGNVEILVFYSYFLEFFSYTYFNLILIVFFLYKIFFISNKLKYSHIGNYIIEEKTTMDLVDFYKKIKPNLLLFILFIFIFHSFVFIEFLSYPVKYLWISIYIILWILFININKIFIDVFFELLNSKIHIIFENNVQSFYNKNKNILTFGLIFFYFIPFVYILKLSIDLYHNWLRKKK